MKVREMVEAGWE